MNLTFTPVDSSNVFAVAYDAKGETLHVKFKDARHYTYGGINEAAHAALMAAPSIGQHVNRAIKPIATLTRRIA